MKTTRIIIAVSSIILVATASVLIARLRNPLLMADWINNSSDDTLEVFCYKGKRGYFNVYTSEIIIQPQYERAWLFSEGLAAVQKEGSIGFINHSDSVVIGFIIPYYENKNNSFIFKNGYCVIPDERGKLGAIDRKGEWVITPRYDKISAYKDYAIVTENGKKMQISYDGKVINPFVIDGMEKLMFQKNTYGVDNDSYNEVDTGLFVYSVDGKYGLMDSQCNRLTEPLYNRIDALNDKIIVASLQEGDSCIILKRDGGIMIN